MKEIVGLCRTEVHYGNVHVLVKSAKGGTNNAKDALDSNLSHIWQPSFGDDCPDDGCPDLKRNSNSYSSFTYGANVDRLEASTSSSGRLGLNAVATLTVVGLMNVLARFRF